MDRQQWPALETLSKITKKANTRSRLQTPAIHDDNIAIRKSSIRSAGGGVFYIGDDRIPQGKLLGFYNGGKRVENSDYRFQGGRDAADPSGRLLMNDGTLQNTHEWSDEDWKQNTNLQTYGVKWIAGDEKSNWTRFMNHGSGAFINVAMASSSVERFGRAFAFYASKPILSGDELFYDYGSGYFATRCYIPVQPDYRIARPNHSHASPPDRPPLSSPPPITGLP